MLLPDFQDITLLQDNILLQRIIIILIYALLAKAIDIFINRFLLKIANFSKTETDNRIIELLHRPIFWTVFCTGIQHAIIISPLPSPWGSVLPILAKSIILLSWTLAIFKALHFIISKKSFELLIRREVSIDAFNICKKLLRICLLAIAFLWCLTLWDIKLTPLFASAGIAGIAVAMAAKDTLANFFGGMSLFMDNTFKEGDYIVLDSGERGEVIDIGMRSSRIKTRDDILISIPNSILANTKIINESAPIPRYRIRIPVGVAYGTNPDELERVLLEVAENNTKIVKNPSPRVRFRALGSSSIDFELLCWIKEPSLRGLATHDLLKAIYTKLANEHITIPFQQMDLHIKNQANYKEA